MNPRQNPPIAKRKMNSSAPPADPKQSKKKTPALRGGIKKGHLAESSSEVSVEPEVPPHIYKRPMPAVVTDAVFMWEQVACFSEPKQVVELERLCRPTSSALAASNRGTHLMQRYWNAQWTRMVWNENEVPAKKRFLDVSSLSRNEGRRSWKAAYVEEYPFWIQRTYQGKGIRNNEANEAKALFHREQLNVVLTAAQLKAMELTEEEARIKEEQKRGVEVIFEGASQGTATATTAGGGGAPSAAVKEDGKGKRKKKGGKGSGAPHLVVQKAPGESYTRDDYKLDSRSGTRKGKHQKGGVSKWSHYDDFGDYNY